MTDFFADSDKTTAIGLHDSSRLARIFEDVELDV